MIELKDVSFTYESGETENKVLWHRPMDDEAIKLLRAFFSHEKGANITNAS